jgi:hypothetical protein
VDSSSSLMRSPHALTPQAIEQVVHLSERDEVAEHKATLAREAKDVDKRIARLVAAIEAGGHVPSLVAKLRDLEARRQAINVEAASLQPVLRLEPAVIENRLAEWRRLLRQSTTQGRTVLQRVLRGPLRPKSTERPARWRATSLKGRGALASSSQESPSQRRHT